jgi:predicted transcriptional regulator
MQVKFFPEFTSPMDFITDFLESKKGMTISDLGEKAKVPKSTLFVGLSADSTRCINNENARKLAKAMRLSKEDAEKFIWLCWWDGVVKRDDSGHSAVLRGALVASFGEDLGIADLNPREKGIEALLRRERLVAERERIASEREALLAERDSTLTKETGALTEREKIILERERGIEDRLKGLRRLMKDV